MPFPNNYTLYYLVASAYQPPEILRLIATDRSQPYTHFERKRTRNRWRFYDDLHGPVYKTTYVRREYAVSCDQGGVLQPIQEHSWDVTWHVPDARGVQNTLFFVHPYSSVRELQTYFVFAPDSGVEGVVRSKKTYDSPDKLLGGSPFEKIFQNEDTLIALYSIAPGTRFPHINGRLFEKNLPIPHFNSAMRAQLIACCELNWAAISPAIFGAMFQKIIELDAKDRRRQLGAHYTSEANILKLIGPLFLDELRAEFARVKKDKTNSLHFIKSCAASPFLTPPAAVATSSSSPTVSSGGLSWKCCARHKPLGTSPMCFAPCKSTSISATA